MARKPSEAELKAWLKDPRYGWVPLGRDAFGLIEVDQLVESCTARRETLE
jgi:hypothetical protein